MIASPLAAAVAVAATVLAFGWIAPAGPRAAAPTPAADDPGAHERGRTIYNFRCYFCHGYSGDARTVATSYLEPPPRDFTSAGAAQLTPERIEQVLREGVPGTAMRPFAGVLDDTAIALVARFVVTEFVRSRRANTRYHTAANGWPDHERTRAAWPFARGELAIDAAADTLSPEQRAGQRLFLATCVSCHDRARDTPVGTAWDTRPVSYPPDGHDCTSCHDRLRFPGRGQPPRHKPVSYHGQTVRGGDARQGGEVAPDDPYGAHDIPLSIAGLSPFERRGERMYLANCAFCHAADGTARNWIGRFLEPHPRDFTATNAMRGMTRSEVARRIRDGVPGTPMSAWKHALPPRDIDAIVAYLARAFGGIADDRPPRRATRPPARAPAGATDRG